MFGVMFKVLKPISMRIGFDQELAAALWRTGNFDARNLASKIADASRITPSELDRWAHDFGGWVGSMYIGAIAAESPHGAAKADEWTRSGDDTTRATGWSLVGQLATRHDTKPDAWFEARLADIEKRVAAAPKFEREAMNRTLIEIGSRSAALRKAVVAASKRIGKAQADRGDTLCRTQDAGPVLDKYWAGAAAAGFASPAAQERARQSPRVRC
jgi:3-methyladenine DNA glycosylase AlkD